MFSLNHVFYSFFRQVLTKNNHTWISWWALWKIPVAVISMQLDRRLIEVFLVHFGLGYAQDVWFSIVNVSEKMFFGVYWAHTIYIPITYHKFACGLASSELPSMYRRFDLGWDRIYQSFFEYFSSTLPFRNQLLILCLFLYWWAGGLCVFNYIMNRYL